MIKLIWLLEILPTTGCFHTSTGARGEGKSPHLKWSWDYKGSIFGFRVSGGKSKTFFLSAVWGRWYFEMLTAAKLQKQWKSTKMKSFYLCGFLSIFKLDFLLQCRTNHVCHIKNFIFFSCPFWRERIFICQAKNTYLKGPHWLYNKTLTCYDTENIKENKNFWFTAVYFYLWFMSNSPSCLSTLEEPWRQVT